MLIGSIISVHIDLYTGHSNKKYISVSTAHVQKGQKRSYFGMFLYRPVSIIRLWLDNLNLVISVLRAGFLISIKYFSNPISVLRNA